MRVKAFLQPPLLRTPSPHYKLRQNTRISHRLQTCTATATAVIPSTNLRNSAQFLRHHWYNAIARTASPSLTPRAIDATAGRGSDTLILAEYLAPNGTIHSFDIQYPAIAETRLRYQQASQHTPLAELRLHNTSHADFSLLGLPHRSVSVVAYNLGWYPGRDADRSLVTTADTTISSLASAQQLVAVGGLISVMAYVGHPGGKEEEQAVIDWSARLCKREWSVVLVTYPNRENAPSLLLCERIS